ncbi:MAG TPA: ketopantoate reductase family protein [Vicinamibacteria bacterium]|nr:ketopantoate reductase family protein [Vicinamibacteria bacterium]
MSLDASPPRVLILGTGAMATTLGAYLARGEDAEVTLAGTWVDGIEAIRRHGVRVEDASGAWTSGPAAVPIAEAPEADVVLVLVKSTQTETPPVERAVKHGAESGALVVTLQNGLGNREALARGADVAHVAVGVATLGATLVAPGRVRAFPGDVVFAREGRPEADEALMRLAGLLSRAGIPGSTSADVGPLLWTKLAVNCAINPLAALTGLTNGALLDNPRLRTLMAEAAREVGEVAAAQGMELPEDPARRAEAVAEATAGNRASMLQDIERGVRTEIEFLNGAVVAEAVRRGVRTPVNDWLCRSVRARETALCLRPRLTA